MNVFLVDTPLQLLNALEAKHYFEFQNNALFVLLTGQIPKTMFTNLVNSTDWDSYRLVNFHFVNEKLRKYDFAEQKPQNIYEQAIEKYSSYKQLIKKWRLNRLAKKIGSAENLILGNYRNGQNDAMRHFANMLRHNRLFLIDDGTDALWVNEERKKGGVCKREEAEPRGWVKKQRARLRKKYLEWNGVPERNLIFFSCYDLSVSESDTLVKNDYRYMRSLCSESTPKSEVIFLGQSLIDDGYMTGENYLKYLFAVKRYFRGTKVIYVPHPRESIRYQELVSKQVGFETKRLSVPIEFEITVRRNVPRCLASFFCSALQNCIYVLDKRVPIKSFEISENDLLKEVHNVSEIYRYFRERSGSIVEVIKVDF